MFSTEVRVRNKDFILTIFDEELAIGSINIIEKHHELIPLLQDLFVKYNHGIIERDNPSPQTVTGGNGNKG